MEQIHLVIYLESKNCEVVRIDKKGMYVMRNKETRKIASVPVPSRGLLLKEATICLACRTLGVESPPSTPLEVHKLLESIQEDIEREKNQSPE